MYVTFHVSSLKHIQWQSQQVTGCYLAVDICTLMLEMYKQLPCLVKLL